MDTDVLVLYALVTLPVAVVLVFGFKMLLKLYYVQSYNSSLIRALENGEPKKAIEILERIPGDYPLDSSDRFGLKMIHQAALIGDVSLIEKLADRPAGNKIGINDVVETTGNSALHLAALQGKKQTVEAIINCQADVNMCNREGWTPLHLACMKGRHQVKTVLLEHGADESLKTRSGLTAFQLQEEEKIHHGNRGTWPGNTD